MPRPEAGATAGVLTRDAFPYIGGEFCASTTGGTLTKFDPTTGEPLGEVHVAGQQEIDAALDAARRALPQWSGLGTARRRAVMLRLAAEIRAEEESLGRIGTAESGVPCATSRSMARRSAEFIEYYAVAADDAALTPSSRLPSGLVGTEFHEPYGVIGVLPSWNGHSGMWRKCAAALAAGNCVVLKPSELAPFAALHYAEIAARAGLPDGVLNVLTGGPETGQGVVCHPFVDKVSFTGGRVGAQAVMTTAARSTTPVVLELGGKSAAVVFSDVDVEAVGRQIALACMALSGQGCVNPTRLLVHRSVLDQALRSVLASVAALQVGDPAAPATDLGPLITAAAQQRVNTWIDDCRANGWGTVLTASASPSERLPPGGYFVRPAVVADADMSSPIAQHEIFGPVLCVSGFDTEEEALRLANDTAFGLSAYVFSSDLDRARRVARGVQAGCVSVNRVGPIPPELPFGGMKGSGFGREGGRAGLFEFLQTRVLCEGDAAAALGTAPSDWLVSETPVHR